MAERLSDSEDEDLKRAIAMSLQDTSSPQPTADVDLEPSNGKANTTPSMIAAQANDEKITTNTKDSSSKDGPPTIATPAGLNGLLGLDRKAMERERLARLAARKREAPISPPPSKRLKMDGTTTSPSKGVTPAAAAAALQTPPPTQPIPYQPTHQLNGRSNGRTVSRHDHGGSLRFGNGVVKRTFSPLHENDVGIKIEDILDAPNLSIAVLSTFLLDPDWIFEKLDIRRTRFYMILHARSEADRTALRNDFDGVKQARLCLPKLSGAYTCMHSKLMLLFFKDFLRIAIPTANLIKEDWGETGFKENSVFIIDLPRLDEGVSVDFGTVTPFAKNLLQFLEHQDVADDVRLGLLKFNFEATRHLGFVHTSFGSYFDDEMRNTGLPGLSAAVRQLGLATKEPIQLDFAASSLGSLDFGMVNAIYEAAQGKDISKILSKDRTNKLSDEVKKNFRLYFPTDATVRNSLGGTDNADTICLRSKYYDKADFPKSLLRDYLSSRHGLLSHNKVMLVRGKKADGTPMAWAYVGSANCSESAWGRIVKDPKSKKTKINGSNWEAGVIVPVGNPEDIEDLGKAFEGVLDIPFDYKSKELEYRGRQPWYFQG